VALADTSGTVIERYDYNPYGKRQVYFSTGPNNGAVNPTDDSRRWSLSGGGTAAPPNGQPYGLNPIGHQGLMHDETVDLVHNRARTLNPRLGRFMQRDPLGYVDSMNLYAYLASNPLSSVDPSGELVGGGLLVGGAVVGGGFIFLGPGVDTAHAPGPHDNPAAIDRQRDREMREDAQAVARTPVEPLDWGFIVSEAYDCPQGTLTDPGLYLGALPGLSAPLARRMTPDQQALKELVDEATNKGKKRLSRENAGTVKEWAEETAYPGFRAKPGDVSYPSNWPGGGGVPHFHVPGAGRKGHVPIEEGVKSR